MRLLGLWCNRLQPWPFPLVSSLLREDRKRQRSRADSEGQESNKSTNNSPNLPLYQLVQHALKLPPLTATEAIHIIRKGLDDAGMRSEWSMPPVYRLMDSLEAQALRDMPSGFFGDSNWTQVEDTLRMFHRPGGPDNWEYVGLTQKPDDGLTRKQRYLAKLKQDPERLEAAKKKDSARQKSRKSRNWSHMTEAQKEAQRARVRKSKAKKRARKAYGVD